MNILEELTENFQYENSLANPDIRRLISGPFRGFQVNRNGFCYSGFRNRTLKPVRGYYVSSGRGPELIRPWRLCALVWHDQTPALHLDKVHKDNYLNLLSFIKVLEKYPDEYGILMNDLKINYYPLSQDIVFNARTGVVGKAANNFKVKHPIEYRKIEWDYFKEIKENILLDFQSFKNDLTEEWSENLKESSVDTVDKEEPEEELEVCLSDPELGGAPSLQPNGLIVSSTTSIDKLQELFNRRAQLKKELAEVEKQIKETL